MFFKLAESFKMFKSLYLAGHCLHLMMWFGACPVVLAGPFLSGPSSLVAPLSLLSSVGPALHSRLPAAGTDKQAH